MATACPNETHEEADPGQESAIILQSLICLLREKNLLTRVDIEELRAKVYRRASGTSRNPLPYCSVAAASASGAMNRFADYVGKRYGGKRGRGFLD